MEAKLEMDIKPQITDKITPGMFYPIKYGDTLFGITSDAYGVSPGKERLEWARVINNSAYNDRFRGKATDFFPTGQLSFNPKFVGDPNVQAAAQGPCPAGHSYATLWIPTELGHEPTITDDDEDEKLAGEYEPGWTGDEIEDVETPDIEPLDPPLVPPPFPVEADDDDRLLHRVARVQLNTIDVRVKAFPWFSA